MIYSNIFTPPAPHEWTALRRKARPAFHLLPYYSFIPAMLIMVLRLVLDVLTKLLIWQKGGGVGWRLLFERITAGKNEKREFSMRMF